MTITRVTSAVTNVNRLFAWVNKNWKIKKFDYKILNFGCSVLEVVGINTLSKSDWSID